MIGDFAPGVTVRTKFNTVTATGAPITLAGSPVVKAYRDGSTTTEVTTGITLTVDFDGVTGLHEVAIDTSADGTFYAAGSDFTLVLTAGSVNSISVAGATLEAFSLYARSALRPTTAGRTLAVDASGRGDANAVQFAGQTITAPAGVTLPATVASPTNITAGTITTVTTLTNAPSDSSGTTTLLSRLSAARAGYLDNLSAGAVALEASLQALITTVGASAAGISAAVWAYATRVLTAGTNIVLAKGTGVTGFNDLSAAQVNTEADTALVDAGIPTATASVITSDHGAGSYVRNTEPLDAASTRAALGLAAANLDTQVGDLPTNAELATALANALVTALTTPVADSIPADGERPSIAQAAYMQTQFLVERTVAATTVTVGKPDGTPLFTLTLNDPTAPTAITRAT